MIPQFSRSEADHELRRQAGGRNRFVRAAREAVAAHERADDETLERAFDRGRELRLAKALLDWSRAAQAGDRETLRRLRRDVYLLARRLAPADLACELHDLPWSLPCPEFTVPDTTDPNGAESDATDTTAAAFAEALAAALISCDRQ